MGDVLPALSVPALVLAGGAYAVGASWWRRRHPALPSPYTRQALRLAEEHTLVTAEEILADAYAAFGPLYTAPGSPAPAPAPPVIASPPAPPR
ncbi:hypothetical protein OHT52_11745 [Streptomyces sp. NBC_00247]|uniref:hypothetical protein n=1 Tax=Streptomyces sp. NBC_00247 TaxID=2975689 RepID=UPI002E27E5B1|nr:hypothetical protein [Streptomyces sp. NBC_00247]